MQNDEDGKGDAEAFEAREKVEPGRKVEAVVVEVTERPLGVGERC